VSIPGIVQEHQRASPTCLSLYLLAKQKLVNYAFGLAGVLIFGYIFYAYQLYSDMLLQWVFYAPLQIVGYFMWKNGAAPGVVTSDALPDDSMKVSSLTMQEAFSIIFAIIVSARILGVYMANNTDASFPYIDALTTTMSIAASLLMLKKFVENWMIWIAMDLIAIPVYYQKELYVTSGLYVIFLGLAIYGLVTWTQDYLKYRDKDFRY